MSHLNLLKFSLLGLVCLFLSSGIAIGQITSAGNGNWGTTTTWVGGVVPVATDDVEIKAGHTVTLNVNTATTLNSLTIDLGGILSATGTNTVDAVTITVNGTYINGSTGAITVTTMNVNGGATYIHAIDGGALPLATWDLTSMLNVTGVTANEPANLNQSFGELNWNSSGQTTNVYLESDITIKGDFNVMNTGLPYSPGARALRMSPLGISYTINVLGDLEVSNTATFKMNNGGGPCTMNVSGDFILNGGNYTISTGPANSTLNVTGDVNILGGTLLMQEDSNPGATGILNVDGNLTVAAGATITETEVDGTGEIYFSGGSTQTFTDGGTVSNVIDFTVNSGTTLQMAAAGTSIDGDGDFVLSTGATLGITSAAGITTAGATGNVQVTGSRTYDTGANYIYNGSSNQSAGNGLPATVNSLTINNSGGGGNNTVSLALSSSVTGALTVTQGIFDMMANNITSVGSVDMTGTSIIGSGTLTLSGNVTTNASPATSIISAPIALGGADRTFSVADNTAVPDLNITSIISGSDIVIKTGAGSMSLSAANTYTGGTNLTAGSLNINNATAIGTGTLTIAGGAIDNTSGGAIIMTNNNIQSWNSDFVFTGTNDLNLGTGNVTPSGNRQISVNGSNLTVGGVIAGGAISITKLGSGALTLSGSNTFSGGATLSAGTLNINNVNALGNIAGTFTINGGIVDNTSGGSISTANYPQAWNGDFAFTGTDDLDLGTGNVSIGSNRQLTVNGGTLAVKGTISAAAVDLTKAGGGTLNFGANPVTLNGLTISSGTLLSTSGILTLSGSFNNSGTFINNSGTVLYNGASAQGIASVSYHNLTLSGAGQKNATNSVNVANNLNNSAVLDMATFTLSVTGVTTNSGTIRFSGSTNGLALTDGTIEYYGGSQTVTSGTYNNLDINQSGGEAVLAGATNVNGTLTLTARNLNLGGFNLTIGPTGTISVAGPSATKMIINSGGGQLRKEFNATGSFTFPIGDNIGMAEYSPVTLNLTAGGGFGAGDYIAASVIDSKHPDNASASNFLTRYWEITPSGITGPTVDVTATYVAADLSGAAADISAAQLDGVFNQFTNGWNKGGALAGTVSMAGATLTDGQTSAFTGIRGADPVASIDIGAGTTICNGASVVITASVSSGGDSPFSYSWSPATGLSATNVANPTASPISTQAYTVTVTDINGITDTEMTTVTVDALPTTPTITPTGGIVTVCEDGSTVSLTSDAAPNGGTYQWYQDGILVVPATTMAIVLSAQSESGDWTVEVTDGAGAMCTSLLSAATTVTINPLPADQAVAAITSTTICDGGTVTLQITSSQAGINYEIFDNGGGGISVSGSFAGTGSDLDITTSGLVLATHNNDLAVVATNATTGCVLTLSGTETITIEAIPVTPTVNGNISPVCDAAGVDITLSSSVVSTGSYVWYKDGVSTGIFTQTIALSSSADNGDYTVSLVEGASLCEGAQSAAETVVINDLPADQAVAAITSTTICDGGTVTLQITSSQAGINYEIFDNGGGGISVSGSFAGTGSDLDITTSGLVLATHNNDLAVVATNATTGCVLTLSGTETITIEAIPVTPTVNGNISPVCDAAGVDITLSSSVVSTGSYVWYKDGVSTGIFTQTIALSSSADNGDYTVSLVEGASLCEGAQSAAETVVINDLPADQAVAAITSTTICDGGTVTLQITSSQAGINYEIFDNGGGGISVSGSFAGTGSDLDITTSGLVLATHNNDLAVVATNATTGCVLTLSGTETITIEAIPVTPTVNGNISPVCDAAGVDITLSSSVVSTGSYVWYKDGVSTGIFTQTIALSSSADNGDYTVSLVEGASLCEGAQSAAETVVINDLPADQAVAAITSTTICDGGTVTLQITSSQAGINYEIFDNGGGGISVSGSFAGTGSDLDITTSGLVLATHNNDLAVVATNATTGCVLTLSGTETITIEAIPVTPTVNGNISPVCDAAGVDITLSSSVVSTGSYVWYKDGVSTGIFTQTIALSSSADNGDYTVSLVEGASLCEGAQSAAETVVINDLPADQAVAAITSTTICDGGTVTLQITSSQAGINYEIFDNGGGGISVSGSFAGTGSDLDITTSGLVLATHNNDLAVVATNATTGCVLTLSGTETITIEAIPVTPTVNGNISPVCDAAGVDITLSSSVVSTGSYVWYKDGVSTGIFTQTIALSSSADNGDYTVSLVEGASLCEGAQSAAETVVINDLPADQAVAAITSTTICDGGTVTLQITSSQAGINYEIFDNGGGGISVSGSFAGTGSDLDITTSGLVLATHNNDLAVVATNATTGCVLTLSGTETITIEAIPVTPTVNGNISPVCDAAGVDITLSSSVVSTGSYVWYKDGVSTGIFTQTIALSSSADNGDYTVSLVEGASLCEGAQSAAETVVINDLPADQAVAAITSTTICDGGTVTLQITSSQAGINYEIFDNGGGGISVSGSFAGTGSDLDITTSGLVLATHNNDLAVVATNATTGCVLTLSGTETITIEAIPVTPTVNGNISPVCDAAGVDITLSSSVVSTGSYVWYKDGVSTGIFTQTIALSSSADNGDYTVSLVEGASLCEGAQSAAETVVINDLPADQAVAAITSTTICDGGTVTLQITSSQAGINYEIFDNGGGGISVSGSFAGTGSDLDITTSGLVLATHNNDLAVVATNATTGCVLTLSGTETITIEAIPVTPTVNGNISPVCDAAGVDITLSSSVVSTGSYVWYKDGVSTGIFTQTIALSSSADNGDYTVSLVEGASLCEGAQSAAETVVINDLPADQAVAAITSTTICDGGTVTLQITSSQAGINYEIFDNGGGGISVSGSFAGTGSDLDITTSGLVLATHNNDLAVVATNATTGCVLTLSGTETITIEAIPVTPTVNGNISPVCDAAGVDITLSSSVVSTGSYVWYKDGVSTGIFTQTIALSSSADNGDYTVSLVEGASLCEGAQSAAETVVINDLPADQAVAAITSTTICDGGTVTLQITSSQAGINYEIFDNGGGGISVSGSFAGTGSDLDITTSGLVLATHNNDLAVVATNATTGCVLTLSGTETITIEAIPVTPTVNGNISPVCDAAGVDITLSSSVVSTGSYVWYKDGVSTGIFTQTIALSSSADNGDYTVSLVEGASLCEGAQSAAETVVINDLPADQAVAAITSTTICDGGTVTLQITSSQAGINYEIFDNGGGGISVSGSFAGTGSDLDITTSGLVLATHNNDLAVVATNATTGCVLTLSGTETITIEAIPVTPTVNGNISPVCDAAGVDITLSSSVVSTGSYVWYKDGVSTGIFTQTIALSSSADNGDYTVSLVEGASLCEGAQSAAETVVINDLPADQAVAAITSTTICDGGTVTLQITSSQAGINYEIFDNGGGGISVSGSFAGTGSDLDITTSGLVLATHNNDLAVVATNATTGCVLTLSGTETITIEAIPVTPTVNGNISPVCDAAGVDITLSSSVVSTGSYVWYKDGVSTGIFTQTIALSSSADNGDYTVSLVEGASLCEGAQSAAETVVINDLPADQAVAAITSTTICDGGTVTLQITSSQAGINYEIFDNGGGGISVSGSFAGTGSDLDITTSGLVLATHNNDLAVVATNATTGCVLTLSGTETITIEAIPVTPTVNGNISPVCDAAGVDITLSSSVVSTGSYVWYKDGVSTGIFTQTIALSSSADNGDYTVSLVEGASLCEGAQSAAETVVINDLPADQAVAAITSTTICDGGTVTLQITSSQAGINYEIFDNGGGGISVSGSFAGTGSDLDITTSGLVLATHNNDLAVVATNATTGCVLTLSGTETITIEAIPVTPTVNGNISPVCDAAGVDITLSSSVVSTGSYVWYKDGVSTGIFTQTIALSSSADNGDYTVSLVEGASLCEGAQSAAETVVINDLPAAGLTVTPSATAVCDGDVLTFSVDLSEVGVNYELFDGVTSMSAAVGGNGGTIILTSSAFSLPGSPVTIKVTATNASTLCTIDLTDTENITINALPAPVVAGDNLVCAGETGVGYSTADNSPLNSYLWTVVGGTITGGSGTSAITVDWGAGASGTVTVTETVIATSCVTTTAAYNVTITPAPMAFAGPDDVVCEGSGAYTVGGTSSSNGTILWTEASPGSLTNATTLTPTYTPIIGESGSVILTMTVTGAGGCAATTAVDVMVLTIDQLPVANAGVGGSECDLDFIFSAVKSIPSSIGTWTMDSGPGTPVYSNANSPTSLVTVDTYGSYDFRWTEDNNGCTDFQVITVLFEEQPIANAGVGGDVCGKDAGNPFTFTGVASVGLGTWSLTSGPGTESFSSINSATSDVTVDTYGTYVFRWTEVNGGCSDFAEVIVSFYEQPVANAGTGGNVCGTSFNLNGSRSIPLSGGIWTVDNKPAAATVIFADINSPSSLVTIDVFGNYLLRWTETNVACSDFDQASLNFQPQPVVDAGADGEICGKDAGSPFTFTGTATGLGGSLGFWSNETPAVGNATFNPPSGINDPTAEVTVDAYGTYIFRYTEFAGFCSDFDEVTVRFKEIPIVAAADEIICSGETSNVIITNPNTIPGTTFTWVVNSSTNINGESGGSGAVISQLLTSADGVNPGSVTYQITPFGDNCIGLPILTTVTVNPIPDVLATPAAETICNGANTSIALSTPNLVAGTMYTWTVAQTGVSTATDQAVPVAGPISQALTLNVANVQGSVTYTIIPVSPDNCLGAPIDVIVTVDPIPDVAAANETICSGETTNVTITNPNAVPGTTFSWAISASTNVTGATGGTGGIIAQVLTSTDGFNQGTVDYTITPSAGGCPGTPVVITVTVDPTPDVMATPAAENICSGQTTSIALSTPNMVASTTYSWTISVTGGITGALAGGGNNIAQTLVNPGNTPGLVTYTVTPTANGCAGASINVNVVVNPTPTVATSGNETICSGSSTSIALSNPNTVPGTTFSWTVLVNTNVTGAAAGLGNNIIQTLSSTDGTTAGIVTYEVTAFTGGCIGSVTTVDVTVNPDVLVAAGGDQVVCEGTDLVLGGSITGGVTTGTWSTAGDGMFDNTGFGIGTIYTPGATDISSGTVLITLTADDVDGAGGPCPVRLDLFTLTINPIATVSVPADFAICEPVSIPLSGTIGGGATGGLWQVVSGNGALSASSISGNTVSADYFPDVTDVNTVVIMRLITNDPDGPSEPCTTVSADINITIDESAKVTAGANQAICEDVSAPLNGNIFGSVSTGMWTIVSGGDGNFDNANDPLTNYNPGPNDQLLGAVVTLRLTTDDPGTTCGITFAETVVTVNTLPDVFLFGLASPYQEDEPPVTLTGIPPTGAAGVGVFSGPGVIGNQFFPNAANLTPIINTVVYTYTITATGCSNFASSNVIVNPVSVVDFTIIGGNLNGVDELEICSDVGLLQLQGIPDLSLGLSGGFTSIDPIMIPKIINVAGTFYVNTDGLPSGLYDITYTFENTFGAVSTRTHFIKVFAGPIANFSVGNFCVDSPITFTDLSTLGVSPFPGSIDTWNWNFGDGVVDSNQDPNHLYAVAQDYTVTLSVTTNQGCTSQPVGSQTITIGAVPSVAYESSEFCTGDLTEFASLPIDWGTQIPSAITDYTWIFGDGNTLSTGAVPAAAHVYPGSARYDVSMTVTTADGCQATDLHPIDVFPFNPIIIPNEYIQSFEGLPGTSGWFEGAEDFILLSDTSWIEGPPTGNVINTASDGANAWWTGASTLPDHPYYFPGEKSVVNAPCFDITSLTRPMISIDIWNDTQEGFDGLVLQYSIDGGIFWSTIGQVGNGVEWYNTTGILGKPGGDQNGWSGSTGGWVTSRFSLEQVPVGSRNKVRLRMAFGSNEDNPIGAMLNGFAFDNVNIRERNRLTLVENFTSLTNTDYSAISTKMLDFEVQRPNDFIYLNYHIPFPGEDSLFRDNRSEPQTRANSFGISQTIQTAFDGNQYLGNAAGLSIDSLDRRALVDPQFNINLQILSTGSDSLSVMWDLMATEAVENPVIVHTVVIEEEIVYGTSTAYNIVKKFLPNAAGRSDVTMLRFDSGDVIPSVRLDWQIDKKLYAQDQLAVIVFVQEITNGGEPGEIYQVAYAKVTDNKTSSVVTGIDDILEEIAQSIDIYPNPVAGELHFATSNKPGEEFYWRVVDQRGIELMTDSFNFIDGRYSVDTREIPNGVYYLIISAKDKPLTYKKIIVMHR